MNGNPNHTFIVSSNSDEQRAHLVDESSNHAIGKKPESKCHGNKKLQRFRKRRRARGMNESAIHKTLEARKREKERHQSKKQQELASSNTTQTIEPMVLSRSKSIQVSFPDFHRSYTSSCPSCRPDRTPTTS